MSMFWRILLGDEAAGGGGSAVAASSDAGDAGDAGGSDTSDTSTESTDSPSDGDGSGTTDAATTGTDADYSYAPPPEEDDTDNGEEDTDPAGGLGAAPSPAPLTGDAAVAALLAQGQAPTPAAPAPVATPAPAPVAAAPVSPDISAVVKGFADAVGLEATDPALKSFTDILTTAQTEAIAAKQALERQANLASIERVFSIMESAPAFNAEVFGESDAFSEKFGLTAEQLQRRTAVDLQAAQLMKDAKAAGKPISAKAAIRQAVEKVASFYPTSTPKPAAPKPQASPTAMAPGRTQAKKPKDPFAAALDAYEKTRK